VNKVINIKEKFKLFNQYWAPKIVGEIDNYYVKIFKAKDEFTWHKHRNDDEFFFVIKGQLNIKFLYSEITIKEGEFFIVPKGTQHCPYALEESHIMLLGKKRSSKYR